MLFGSIAAADAGQGKEKITAVRHDDLLLAALSGDREAALLVRQRQLERNEQRRTRVQQQQQEQQQEQQQQQQFYRAGWRQTPRHGKYASFADALLRNALSGSGTWIDSENRQSAYSFTPAKPEPTSFRGALATLNQRLASEDKLVLELEAMEADIAAAREATRLQLRERDALLSRLKAQPVESGRV